MGKFAGKSGKKRGRRAPRPLAPMRSGRRSTPRHSPVIVRFECPICGGPHARADH